MIFKIIYHHLVVSKDIPRLGSEWRDKIRQTIEERLTIHPEIFGKPLRRSLKGYRKLRVGNYRIIFSIEKETVKIFIIQHRSTVYDDMEQRK